MIRFDGCEYLNFAGRNGDDPGLRSTAGDEGSTGVKVSRVCFALPDLRGMMTTGQELSGESSEE
jgi:hypothetical protein